MITAFVAFVAVLAVGLLVLGRRIRALRRRVEFLEATTEAQTIIVLKLAARMGAEWLPPGRVELERPRPLPPSSGFFRSIWGGW